MPRSFRHIKSRYNIDRAEFLRIYDKQDRKCPITLAPLRIGKDDPLEYGELGVVDHCHETGKVRGLLPDRINKALGLFEHNPAYLRRAADWLESHGEPND